MTPPTQQWQKVTKDNDSANRNESKSVRPSVFLSPFNIKLKWNWEWEWDKIEEEDWLKEKSIKQTNWNNFDWNGKDNRSIGEVNFTNHSIQANPLNFRNFRIHFRANYSLIIDNL